MRDLKAALKLTCTVFFKARDEDRAVKWGTKKLNRFPSVLVLGQNVHITVSEIFLPRCSTI